MLNELFNELAYNPSPNQAGFGFFAGWGAHNLDSAVAQGEAHGAVGQTLLYFNCELVPILKGVAEVDPTARLIIGLLNPPSASQCAAAAGRRSESRERGRQPDGAARGSGLRPGPRRCRAGAGRAGREPLMQKRAPTLANILVIVLFALSCFGLLLFLWESFGGPVPLKPKGYRFSVELSRTLALGEESDVRISGVTVGHIVSLATYSTGLTKVTVEMNHQYAPVSAKDRMVLRQKTLLGETYLELLPPRGGAAAAGSLLPDGGQIPASQVEPAVTLDDILAALDPKTRAAFKVWQRSLAAAYNGRGEQINSDFAEFEPFVEDANKLVSILNSQEGALRASVHNTGVVFDALTERDNQFRGLIENGERTFHALAQSSAQFAERLPCAADLRAPLGGDAARIRQPLGCREPRVGRVLRVGARAHAAARRREGVHPRLQQPAHQRRPVLKCLQKGPAGVRTHPRPAHAAARQRRPHAAQLRPVPEVHRRLHPRAAGVLRQHNRRDGGSQQKLRHLQRQQIQHYLRTLATINPESLAVYNKRNGTNRANPYFQPGAFRRSTTAGCRSSARPPAPTPPRRSSGPATAAVSKNIIEQLTGSWTETKPAGKPPVHQEEPAVVNGPESTTNTVAAPACNQQAPFTWEGVTSQFPHVTPPAAK